MSVAQPQFLIDFSDASGATLTNKGSAATPYVIGQGSSPGNYTRNTTGGQFGRGFLDILTNSGGGQVWALTAQTGPGTTLETMNVWVAFNLDSLNSGAAWMVGSGGGAYNGGISVHAASPSVAGDFDLRVDARNTAGASIFALFTSAAFGANLAFNTDYVVAAGFSGASAVAVTLKARLALAGGASGVELAPASVDFSGAAALANNWPYIGRRQDFGTHFGCDSQLSGVAYQRGGTVWGSSDLTSINADPNFITGWGAAGHPAGKRFGGIPNVAGGRKGVWRERLSGLLVPDRTILTPRFA